MFFLAAACLLLAFLLSSCVTFKSAGLFMAPGQTGRTITLDQLEANADNYDIYYTGISWDMPAAIFFDPKGDDARIVGKFWVVGGGIEVDLNPIDIYEYSDLIEYMDNFLSGVGIKYFLNRSNYLGLQIYNARTHSFDELYGNDSIIGGAVTASKAPLGVALTWRGSLWDGLISTLWSYSLTNEASGMFKNYIALGQQLNLKRLTVAYDFKISSEDLDRTGMISSIIPRDEYGYVLKNTLYYSHWLQIDWEFVPKWHVAFTGFIDHAKWLGDEDPEKYTNDIRTGYGFIPTVEYHPWDNFNLKFFVGYVGRVYKYSDYTKEKVGATDYDTGRVMVGFISPLKFL